MATTGPDGPETREQGAPSRRPFTGRGSRILRPGAPAPEDPAGGVGTEGLPGRLGPLFGPRSYAGGRFQVYGCSPGCLVVSLVASLILTLLLNLLIGLF